MGWRARRDYGDISGLSSSIAEIGQICPVSVRASASGGHYELVAGLRRLTACKNLNREVLAVEIDVQNEAVDLEMQLVENARRKEFELLELGLGLLRRKAIYEGEHPETRAGGARKGAGRPPANGSGKAANTDTDTDTRPESFVRLMAQKLGLGEDLIWKCLRLAGMGRKEHNRINAAPTPEGRNKEAKQLLREQRQQKKRAKIEALAAERVASEDPGEDPGETIVLHHMDNADFFKACKEPRFDVILTDPPYDSDRKSLISHSRRSSIDTDFGSWDKLDVGWVAHAAPTLEKGGHLLAFSPLEAIGDYREVCLAAGLSWHGAIVWHRKNPGTVHRPVYLSACEAIVWATKPGTTYHFEAFENAGAPECHNLIEGPICGGNERMEHPTQKPEWLIEQLLERHAHSFSHVLDPFAGVGTTLAVCKRLQLRCTGIEREDDYTAQARARLAAIG